MSDENTPSSPPPNRTRRSSFAGETFANLFGGQRGSMSRSTSVNEGNSGSGQQQGQSYQGPITSAAAQAQRRRLSLTTLGLSGSPNQSSPFGSYNARRDSYGTAGSNDSIDESAIEDEPASGPTPQTPFGRRMSFGAKALRDVRTNGGGNTPPGQQSGTNGTSAPSSNGTTTSQKQPNGTISARDAKGRGTAEGFNWSDNFRTRAERTSIAGGGGLSSSPRSAHGRAQSVAIMEPPAREMPKPKEQVRPDHFQERILKGDFYMD
ncbi:hypothetical protein M409DRAFT_71508 [Zasmidium cellare ATCC 36951]|uniref:Uncharacterized protein n=1 Tax=Zasmidium cellare ATCC 36951 TaxID=1080233 RepID=A0A6A6BV96_ZASCE|nr:uncharacterized protein M409DRAFT_71508 [Zasmidium cellare ATCC 36951]KAF2158717.1 hypothetical protein M409DRAFT_71508 [Zasmidium cellare ATCC 36951]